MQSLPNKNKITYIDNLRILLTGLVVMHHTVICYGGPGGWYFTDATTNPSALIVMTLFVATNQAFFMGFFFFLSAYFMEASYAKKGAAAFTKDRLKRLGIPLLFYSFVLSPVMNFLVYKYGLKLPATFIQYLQGYNDWLDPGVLWFVAALLLFTLVYVLFKLWGKRTAGDIKRFPSHQTIFVFALGLGLISYLVRIVFPTGWVLHPLGFQLAHFTQYICLFVLGIVAYRKAWLNSIYLAVAKPWLITALLLVFLIFPGIFLLAKSPLASFAGNGTWQSLLAAVWEQLTGVSIMVALTAIGKYKFNFSTPFTQQLSRSAYATYIFHPLVVICISLSLQSWSVDPVFKLLVAAPTAVVLSFCLGWLLVKLPVVKEII